jgi:hypothetical protein
MTLSRAVRYRCELVAQFTCDAGVFEARVLELSENGAFLEEGELPVGPGDQATLALSLPGGTPLQAALTVVRWGSNRQELRHASVDHLTLARRGFGVEFQAMDDDELERLRDFLELLDGR